MQCRARGWRVHLDGEYPDGQRQSGFRMTTLDIVSADRSRILATVSADPVTLDRDALEAARALKRKGLIGGAA